MSRHAAFVRLNWPQVSNAVLLAVASPTSWTQLKVEYLPNSTDPARLDSLQAVPGVSSLAALTRLRHLLLVCQQL